MATVYKRPGAKNFSADYTLHTGERTTKTTRTANRKLAKRIAHEWEEAELERKTGLRDPRLESIATKERYPLLTPAPSTKCPAPAPGHFEAYIAFRAGNRAGPKRQAKLRLQLTRVAARCPASTYPQMTPERVRNAIEEMRRPEADNGLDLGNTTSNEYLRTCKSFAAWMVRSHRSLINLLSELEPYNDEEDPRRVRRAFEAEELRLIYAEAERPESAQVTIPKRYRHHRDRRARDERTVIEGTRTVYLPDRVWSYRIGEGAGYRLGEVSSITRAGCLVDTGVSNPSISVEANYSKRGRRDTIPIKLELAAMLRGWLEGSNGNPAKQWDEPLCPIPETIGAAVLRADMAAARARWIANAPNDDERQRRAASDFLSPIDHRGMIADFHSLRHTYCTNVVDATDNLKEAQELCRHSSIELTMKYAKTKAGRLRQVVNRMATAETPATPAPLTLATGA